MCRSKNEGGQRCYSHARQILQAALAARESLVPLFTLTALGAQDGPTEKTLRAVEGRIMRAQLDVATTVRGRAEFQVQADAARGSNDMESAARLDLLIERGKLLAERNAAMLNLHRNDRFKGVSPRRPAPDLGLSPQQVREHLAQEQTPDQAAAICRDLEETLLKFGRSIRHRKRFEYRVDDEMTKLLVGPVEVANEDARRGHQWSAFGYAQQRWKAISKTVDFDDATAFGLFVTQTRHARDNPPGNVAFVDDYRRDNNFILRVCAEIVHANSCR